LQGRTSDAPSRTVTGSRTSFGHSGDSEQWRQVHQIREYNNDITLLQVVCILLLKAQKCYHPHVVPNLYDLLFWNTKGEIFAFFFTMMSSSKNNIRTPKMFHKSSLYTVQTNLQELYSLSLYP